MIDPIIIDADSKLVRWLVFASRVKNANYLRINSRCQLISSLCWYTFFVLSAVVVALFLGYSNGTVWLALFNAWQENSETWTVASLNESIALPFLIAFGVTTMLAILGAASVAAISAIVLVVGLVYYSWLLLQKLFSMANDRLEAKHGPSNKYARLRSWLEALSGRICRPVRIQKVSK